MSVPQAEIDTFLRRKLSTRLGEALAELRISTNLGEALAELRISTPEMPLDTTYGV